MKTIRVPIDPKRLKKGKRKWNKIFEPLPKNKKENPRFTIGFVAHGADCKILNKKGEVKKKGLCTCGVIDIALDVQSMLNSFKY